MSNRGLAYYRIGKYLSRAAAALFIVGFLFLMYLIFSFMSEPTQPVPAAGKIVPWSSHGTIHYLTLEEHRLLNWTLVFCVCMFFCAGIGIYLEKAFGDSGRSSN
jgi:hypothetical protein